MRLNCVAGVAGLHKLGVVIATRAVLHPSPLREKAGREKEKNMHTHTHREKQNTRRHSTELGKQWLNKENSKLVKQVRYAE